MDMQKLQNDRRARKFVRATAAVKRFGVALKRRSPKRLAEAMGRVAEAAKPGCTAH